MMAKELRKGDVVRLDDRVVLISKVSVPPKLYGTGRMSCQGHVIRTEMDLSIPPKGDPNVYSLDQTEILHRMAWMVVAGRGAWLPIL